MKQLILLILTLPIMAQAQDILLDIHGKRLADFRKFEQNLGATPEPNKYHQLQSADIAQPVIYRRKQQGMPDLLAYCYVYARDSSIEYLLYEWDQSNMPGNREDTKIPLSQVLQLIKTYNALTDQLTVKFGKSQTKGAITDTSKLDEGLQREDNWTPNDSTAVKMYTVLSTRYEQNGAVTITPTYRIRLYINNIEPSAGTGMAPLDDLKIKMLDSVAQTFFSAMAIKDYDKARSCLSVTAARVATDTRLELMSKSFSFDQPLQVWMTGVSLGTDGTPAILFQYRYASDSGTPPKELIRITFDDSNKIKGARSSIKKNIQ